MILISINVFEKPEFLLKHIKNIEEHVQNQHIIVLSCNDYMFDALKYIDMPSNVHVNPEIINKRRFHGSLTQGILSNMRYAMDRFAFDYFIILASGTFFYNSIDIPTLNSLQNTWKNNDEREETIQLDISTNYNSWHWPSFLTTQLGVYYNTLNRKMIGCAHEGITFSINVCKNILQFLTTHKDIEQNLVSCEHCVEEFSLQTIAFNEVDFTNREYGHIVLGRGFWIESKPTDKEKWTYKRSRCNYEFDLIFNKYVFQEGIEYSSVNDSCSITLCNNKVLFKKKASSTTNYCWFGYILKKGDHNLSFDIISDTDISVPFLKSHNPAQFFPIENILKAERITIHTTISIINDDTLFIFIFDDFKDILTITVENIIFK
jgi:hypothetical protein